MAERRALITGAAGFIGKHLAAYLNGRGLAVFGLDRPGVAVMPGWPGHWIQADVTNAPSLNTTLREAQPDYIFHLAALLRSSSLSDLLTVNVVGTQNLLDAVVAICPRARLMVAGSAAEYGLVLRGELPVRETNPLRPLTPYGVSKAAQGLLTIQYAYSCRLSVVYTRTFNLTGPGEPPGMVGGDFARRIVQVERGGAAGSMQVGNLATMRDFVDVRDAVQAYWLVCSQGKPGEVYNVCSGKPIKIEQVLHILIGYSTSRILVEVDTKFFSPQDVPISFGNAEKLCQTTGWQPAILLEESLRDLLEDCRRGG